MPKVKKKNIGGNPILFVKTAKKAVELGKKGKTMYIWPIPFPWLF